MRRNQNERHRSVILPIDRRKRTKKNFNDKKNTAGGLVVQLYSSSSESRTIVPKRPSVSRSINTENRHSFPNSKSWQHRNCSPRLDVQKFLLSTRTTLFSTSTSSSATDKASPTPGFLPPSVSSTAVNDEKEETITSSAVDNHASTNDPVSDNGISSTKAKNNLDETYTDPAPRSTDYKGFMNRAKGIEEMREGADGSLDKLVAGAKQTIKVGPKYVAMVQHLRNLAKKIWLEDKLDIMIKNVKNLTVKEGILLLQKGDMVHHMLIVLNDGGVLTSPTKCYKRGMPFGHNSLVGVFPSSHALISIGNCELLAIDGREFRRDLQEHTKTEKDAVRDVLKMSGQFSQLHFTVQDELGAHLQPANFNTGEALMMEGDIGEDMFFITSGTADIHINMGKGNTTKVVAQVTSGTVIGEGALFDSNSRRSASVIAASKMKCFRLLYKDFHRIAPKAMEFLQIKYLRVVLLKQGKGKFDGMPDDVIDELCRCAKMSFYQKGQYIIKEGDAVTDQSFLYILKRGTVSFEKTFNEKDGKKCLLDYNYYHYYSIF